MKKTTLPFLSFCTIFAGGCTNQICPDRLPELYQISPSGRAVAYVDREIFANIFDWLERTASDPETSFDCLIDYFTARLSNDVDIIFVVMNQSREEFLQRSERNVISNFTAAQRLFERGIGTLRRSLLSTVGSPSLRSYSFFSVREGLTAGPSLHEIAHGWCAYLDGPSSLAGQIDREPFSHWGFTSVGGVLGGWDPAGLESLGDRKYRVCGPSPLEGFAPQGYANNNIPYSPLELYLMGLLPPEEVPDIRVALNPVVAGQEGSCVAFFADELETVTIEDIIAVNGPRRPSTDQSQKHFNIALVIIAEDPLTDGEWQFYEDAMVCLESTTSCGVEVTGVNTNGQQVQFVPLNFFEATGGRASIRFATLQEIIAPDFEPISKFKEPRARLGVSSTSARADTRVESSWDRFLSDDSLTNATPQNTPCGDERLMSEMSCEE